MRSRLLAGSELESTAGGRDFSSDDQGVVDGLVEGSARFHALTHHPNFDVIQPECLLGWGWVYQVDVCLACNLTLTHKDTNLLVDEDDVVFLHPEEGDARRLLLVGISHH